MKYSYWIATSRHRTPPEEGGAVVTLQGGVANVRVWEFDYSSPAPVVEHAKRGKIVEFSARSRRALLRKVHKIGEGATPILITLTFHRLKVSPAEAKTKLDTWLKRLKRAYPHVSAFWKIEPQKRGTPHFHLMAYGGTIPRKWIAETWNAVAEPGDEAHLRAGTRVEWAKDRKRALGYASKTLAATWYVGKAFQHPWGECGRLWGVHNKLAMPFGVVHVRHVTTEHGLRVIRTIRKLARQGCCSHIAITAYLHPSTVNELLRL